jgi:hypothetical protein
VELIENKQVEFSVAPKSAQEYENKDDRTKIEADSSGRIGILGRRMRFES